MTIREYLPRDKEIVDRIFNQYYFADNEAVDFGKNFLSAFTIEEDGKIITVGGVRSLAEIVCRTDKSFYTGQRREALYNLLQASQFVCSKFGYNQLHAWAKDPAWIGHLRKAGFTLENNPCLILDL